MRHERKGRPIEAIGGPDSQGRLALIESGLDTNTKHALKIVSMDGSRERVLLTRPGRSFWDEPFGEHLALSPTGGKVALVGQGRSQSFPGAVANVGLLELWDIATGAGGATDIKAVDASLQWSPDGSRLAYIGLTEDPDSERAAFILDTSTARARMVARGRGIILSPDWEYALLFQGSGTPLRVQMATGESEPVESPAGWLWFLLPDDFAIFLGLPTRGTPPRWLEHGSFLAGSLMPSIKLGELRTGRFQTIVPYADFRNEMSFGAVSCRPDLRQHTGRG